MGTTAGEHDMRTCDSGNTEMQLKELEEQGYTLIPDFLSRGQLQQVNAMYDTTLATQKPTWISPSASKTSLSL
jgi:hypothetical protein